MSLTKEKIEIIGSLLKALKKLKKENKFYVDGEKKAKESIRGRNIAVTPVASYVLTCLFQLMPFDYGLSLKEFPISRREEIIENTEEFLAIFEEEGETVTVPVEVLQKIMRKSVPKFADIGSSDMDEIKEIVKGLLPRKFWPK